MKKRLRRLFRLAPQAPSIDALLAPHHATLTAERAELEKESRELADRKKVLSAKLAANDAGFAALKRVKAEANSQKRLKA